MSKQNRKIAAMISVDLRHSHALFRESANQKQPRQKNLK